MSEGASSDSAGKRVVVIAVDGSENAKEAFKFYVKDVRKENDKVYLIYSVEMNSVLHSTQWYSSPYSFDKEMLTNLLEEEKKKIKAKLEKFAEMLKESGCDGTVKSIHAESPGAGICKAAAEVNGSIIVIGTRGLGTIRRTFMGSVSDYVLHHAHVPVLVFRSQEHQGQQEQHQKKQ